MVACQILRMMKGTAFCFQIPTKLGKECKCVHTIHSSSRYLMSSDTKEEDGEISGINGQK